MEWIQGKHQIKEYFLREFKDLFTSDNPSIHNELEHLVEKKIFMEDNIAMMAVPLEEEIKDCVWTLHPVKSPGPDGYPGIFYRKYWSIVKDQVIKCVQECFRTISIAKGLNRTLIVLIPKTNQPTNFHLFRPHQFV